MKGVEEVAAIGNGRFVPDCRSVFSLSIGVLKRINGGGQCEEASMDNDTINRMNSRNLIITANERAKILSNKQTVGMSKCNAAFIAVYSYPYPICIWR